MIVRHASMDAATTSNLKQAVDSEFRAWVEAESFACVGARSAVHRGTYTLQLYRSLGSHAASRELARDLGAFARDLSGTEEFVTFVAAFKGPEPHDERHFEHLLWQQLRRLHALDGRPWDGSVSRDPIDDRFAFSFGGHAFFVVGLHPASSRTSRRFGHPALAFNPRAQFERMREDGRFARLQRAIRARDLAIDGSINPMLSDFGERSEARQYSGRAVPDDWRCPFHTDDR